jgi:hypothetical protein
MDSAASAPQRSQRRSRSSCPACASPRRACAPMRRNTCARRSRCRCSITSSAPRARSTASRSSNRSCSPFITTPARSARSKAMRRPTAQARARSAARRRSGITASSARARSPASPIPARRRTPRGSRRSTRARVITSRSRSPTIRRRRCPMSAFSIPTARSSATGCSRARRRTTPACSTARTQQALSSAMLPARSARPRISRRRRSRRTTSSPTAWRRTRSF